MNGLDLSKLEALTKDYASFQARKSGLATALGGLMALLEVMVVMYSGGQGQARTLWIWLVCAMPLLWLVVKPLIEHWLYQGLGRVKAEPDAAQERRRWLWIFGLSLFLLAFQTLFLLGYIRWNLATAQRVEALKELPGIMADVWRPWLLALGLPFLYLAAAPFGIRGAEEARAYAVMTAQALSFSLELWGARGVWLFGVFNLAAALVFMLLQFSILVWAALAMIRGWKEHREYLALLHELVPHKDPLTDRNLHGKPTR